MLIPKKGIDSSAPQVVYLALSFFAILSFLQWEPPGFFFWLESFRWYIMLLVAGFLFIIQRGYLNIPSAKFYIVFNSLAWLGTLLSLLRTPSPDQVLYTAVSMSIPFFLGLVLIPVISTDKGRLAWIAALLAAALLWGSQTIFLWLEQGENIRHVLAGSGTDHNAISLCLAVAATALMIVALYGNFSFNRLWQSLLKVVCFFISSGFLVCSFLTYSRSGFIVTLAGIFFAVFTLLISNKIKMFFIILSISLFLGWTMISTVQITNPTWFIKINEISRLEDPNTSVFVRTILVQKAWELIGENPIIGIGPGIFRTIYDPLIGHQSFYLPHNTYLATWAEMGSLGFIGYIVWLSLWIRLFFRNWNKFNLYQRVLLSIFVPFFIMLTFLDIGGLMLTIMLATFSGLQYSSEL